MTGEATDPGGGVPTGEPAGKPAAGRDTGRFDDFADRYARFNELRDRFHPAVTHWLQEQLPGGGRAVDLGCGDGFHTGWLADRYAQVLAVDLSPRMLTLARGCHHRPHVRYEQRGVRDVTVDRDGRFDAVLSVNTLHHVGPPATVLAHARDLVAPGGRLVVVDIVAPEGWGDRDWHVAQGFDAARGFYQHSGGDPDVAADVLRLLLHPRWLDMLMTDHPPTREELHRHAAHTLPGAQVHDGFDPVVCAVAWRHPAPA